MNIRFLTALLVLVVSSASRGSSPRESPADPFAGSPVKPPQGQVDKLILARLKRLGTPPARLCSDAVFLRRIFLDVIGTLPTADEARDFLDDPTPDKRQ